MRLATDKQAEYARELVGGLAGDLGQELADAILNADQSDEAGIDAQRQRVDQVREILAGSSNPKAAELLGVAEYLVQRSIWIVGGDGWAYDIGYGGLDHVLASGRNVNVLVLDTEVYSNTGGQASKSTPRGAVAKFAAAGKPLPKKDLGMISMSYGNIYVAQVAMGANDNQCLKAFLEADAYDGPSLIIAYSHCIAHGVDMTTGMTHQNLAVDSGHWPLYRFDPRLTDEGKNPMQLDSKAPSIPVEEYAYKETRFKMLTKSKPERAKMLIEELQADVTQKWARYEKLASDNGKEAGGE
jgi:pyruvate-ferredoxin/flavodoxin oxidoreductase